MKQIIVACIMAMSIVTTHAQDVENSPDNLSSTSQNEVMMGQSNPVNGMEQTSSQENEDNNGGLGGVESKDSLSITATNVSNFYEETPPAKEQSDWGFIALIVAVLSLLVAGYNFATSQSKNDNKKGRQSRQQDYQPNIEKNILNKINILNGDLKAQISQLSNRVEDLESQLNRLSSVQPNNAKMVAHSENSFKSASRSEYSSNQSNFNIGGTKLYATQVQSDCFPEEGLSDNNIDYAIAILSVKGDSGTYIINDRASAQSFLISNYAYGAGRVSDVNQQGDYPTRIETIKPGSIKRQANGWKITAKAQVNLV